jgi:hypothetical protein
MHKPAHLTRPCLAAATAMAAFLLAGCHSGSSAKGAPGAGGPSGAASAASAASAAAGSAAAGGGALASDAAAGPSDAAASGKPAVTCDQLTFAQVQPFIGDKVTKDDVTVMNAEGLSGETCNFSNGTSDGNTLSVLVLKGSGAAAAYADDVSNDTDGVVAVPGIGDKASREKGSGGLDALKGDVICSTGVDEEMTDIGILELAANGTTHIAENLYQDGAIAVGTLCNRIFGSGNTTPDLSALDAAAAAASASASASAAANSAAESAAAAPPSAAASS